ncbi:prominin-1-like [Gigantopelta aegis]|uniref:prominin-1-like n=1 Tax=Gigantopelta aegis TaxID=1735272 RepID=UPI001B8891D0|nr:prominin-1-like [Gigantopelta aegis]
MIKTKLQAGVNNTVQKINVQAQIDKMTRENIDTIQADISNAISQAKSSIRDMGIETTVADNVKLFSQYDKYRNYGGIGLASILLLVVLLQGFGLAFGLFGSNSNAKPTERGCLSNAGGNMLMASVGFLFIFGAIIILITSMLYLTGSIVERYMCQSFKNPSRIEKYANTFTNIDLENIQFAVQGKMLKFSISGILRSCKEGKTLYDAVQLGNVIDIRDMLNKVKSYKDKMIPTDFAKNLDLTNLHLSDNAGKLKQQITTLKGSSKQMDDVTKKIQTLRLLLTKLHPGGFTSVNKLEASIKQLQPIITQLPKTLNGLTTILTQLDTDLPKKAGKYIKASVDFFTGHIFGIFDSFVNDTMHHLHTDLGNCRPIWSVYNALVLETLCHGIVDPLNGFWLALGWTIFFGLPSLVFSVKLAKHLRRMKYLDEFGTTTSEENAMTTFAISSEGKPFANKVEHQDIQGSILP